MSEQFTLFDEALTPETLGGKLGDILEAAREKSGYYRLHESGMYEMMKGAPASELYDILEIRKSKSGDISFNFDGQLYIKFLVKKEALNTTKELFAELLSNHESEQLSGNEAPKKGVRVILPIDQQVEFFKQALDYLIRIKRPVNRFAVSIGCLVSAYLFNSLHCPQLFDQRFQSSGITHHEHPYYSKGCYYRENLENGKSFYK